jgi:hypothetical protein
MSAGCAGLETNLRRYAAVQLQNLLITNKKRRTRKRPGPAYFIW